MRLPKFLQRIIARNPSTLTKEHGHSVKPCKIKQDIRITVNGETKRTHVTRMTYINAVKLAGYDHIHGAYKVKYQVPPSPPMGTEGGKGGLAGTLKAGNPIEVREGSSFTVEKIA